MRRLLAVAGSLAIAGLLTGCLPTGGPVATRHGTGANMDALLTGTLRLNEECAWIETEDGGYIPVFELGVARYEAGRLVYGRHYADGDAIEIGGGETNDDSGADWYIPSGCPDLKLWVAAPPPEA